MQQDAFKRAGRCLVYSWSHILLQLRFSAVNVVCGTELPIASTTTMPTVKAYSYHLLFASPLLCRLLRGIVDVHVGLHFVLGSYDCVVRLESASNYTLIIVDPDAPNSTNPVSAPISHAVYANIPGRLFPFAPYRRDRWKSSYLCYRL